MHLMTFWKAHCMAIERNRILVLYALLRTHSTHIADTTYTSSPPRCKALLPHTKPRLYKASRSWLAGLNFHTMMTSQHKMSDPTNWPWHIAAHHFYLALPLWLFNVGRKCKINVSACERYTINCGILSIQNTQTDLAEVARCTLPVSCSTGLDCCFCQSGPCISWTCT